MSSEIAKFGDACEATVSRSAGSAELVGLEGTYVAECYDAQGNLKWTDEIKNLVTDVGRQDMLDKYFSNTGAGAVVMGLAGANGSATFTPAYTDTQASHAGWYEVGNANAPTYSGARKTPAFAGATNANPSVLSTSAPVIFSMTGSGTVYGAFINVNGASTVDDTTGILFSIGAFTAGSKTVTSGDTINVTYTLSAAG